MVKVKATIKDNENKDFEIAITAEIETTDYLIYNDCMNTCSSEEYNRAWDNICSCFQNQNNLPESWYVDGSIESIPMEEN